MRVAVTLGVVCAVAGSLVVGLTATLTAQTSGQEAWEGTPQQAFYESDIVDKYQCDTCHTIMTRGGTVGPILNQGGQNRPFDAGNLAVSWFGQNIVVAERSGPETIKVTLWRPVTGERLAGDEQIAELIPAPPGGGEGMAHWLLMATLALIFMSILRRRRANPPKQDKS